MFWKLRVKKAVLALESPLSDEAFMEAAIQIADSPTHSLFPNPRVGAVIVQNSKILATGYHRGPGFPHAEVEAIRQAESSGCQNFSKATIYVSLEPCCHLNKRTPPCAPLLVQKKFARVVVASLDPNPKVSGGGVAMLKKSGIPVDVGCLESAARELNRSFFKNQTQLLPYVILKVAMTFDGKMADDFDSSKWISGEGSRKVVQSLRARADAVAIGSRTFDLDNPSLNARTLAGNFQKKVLIFGKPKRKMSKSKAAIANGLQNIILSPHKSSLKAQLKRLLKNENIGTLVVEGGSKLASSFIRAKMVDEVVLFYGGGLLGGKGRHSFFTESSQARLSKVLPINIVEAKMIEKDLMIRGYL